MREAGKLVIIKEEENSEISTMSVKTLKKICYDGFRKFESVKFCLRKRQITFGASCDLESYSLSNLLTLLNPFENFGLFKLKHSVEFIKMTFQNKVVLITGASSGIGAAAAVHFASLGASLVLTGRNERNLFSISEECKAAGNSTPLAIIADVTKQTDIENIISETIKQFGKLDVLINNAGILENGSIETTTLAQYDRLFDTNVRSIYYLTMLAVPHLIATKGNIVNVSSVAGTRAFPGVLSYCMTKSAIDQFTKCVALELAPKGVRVNSVNPGVIITEIHKRGGMDEKSYAEFLEKCKVTHALGRPGEAKEVAAAIAFLASDAASYTTGEHLHVDGGRHAMCPR